MLPHAESQLFERGLTLNNVKATLENPDQVICGNSKEIKIAQKICKNKGKKFLYRVVFIEQDDKYKVVTVYRTSKIKKYLKED